MEKFSLTGYDRSGEMMRLLREKNQRANFNFQVKKFGKQWPKSKIFLEEIFVQLHHNIQNIKPETKEA